MTTFWAAILVFGVLIFFHELGHFAVAKAVKIRVYEFSLGFGPKLAGLLRNGTAYNIRLLPLGGFVRMAGMDPEDKEAVEGERFGDKTVFQRMAVIAAGPVMNFVLAWILFTVIFFSLGGAPVADSTRIKDVITGYPAEAAGIKPGDEIYSIEGKRVHGWEDITSSIHNRPGLETQIVIIRDDRQIEISVVPMASEDGRGLIGIEPHREPVNPLVALGGALKATGQVTVNIIYFIGQMITGKAPAELGGPVRVIWEIDRAVESGFYYLLNLAAFLSINLGLFNLFPIPALDGSRLMFLTIEGVRGRPVDPVRENFIHLVGFGFLLLLVVFITYNDILQLFMKSTPSP